MSLSVAAVLCFAAFVQGVIGFAMAVVAIPLLVWLGIPLSEAIAISCTSTFIQALTGSYKFRSAIPWTWVRTAILIRLLALPVGILVLRQMETTEPATMKALVGLCIVLIVLLQILLKVEPRESLAPPWDWLAFTSSGLFAGMVGMGGPPLVVWLSALNWTQDKMRAFLYVNFAILSPLNILFIWLSFGDRILSACATGLLFTPVVVLGSLAGMQLGSSISAALFRKALTGALVLLGLASMLSAFVPR